MSDSSDTWTAEDQAGWEARDRRRRELRNDLIAFLKNAEEELGAHYETISWGGEAEVADIVYEAIRDAFDEEVNVGVLGDLLKSIERYAQAYPDGYVYVLKAGDYFKIGRAKDPYERIKTLKIQLPFPVEIYNVFPCEDYCLTERHMHHFYKKNRVNGEWFVFSDATKAPPHQLKRWKFATNVSPDDPWKDVAGPVDLHETVPAAVWANEKWSRAMTVAMTAVERDAIGRTP